MARKRLSEFRAKTILYDALKIPYTGIEIDVADTHWRQQLPTDSINCVVKVDQAVKGRYKKGLVKLERHSKQLTADVAALAKQGYRYFVIEPQVAHTASDERYLALNRTGEGIVITSSEKGGIDIESHATQLRTQIYAPGMTLPDISLSAETLNVLVKIFDNAHMGFLEINPLLHGADGLRLLDAAVEVDDAAAFFAKDYWTSQDIRNHAEKTLASAESQVRQLNEQSQASFNLELLNPDGSLFLLLSGGGASVVVADEIYNVSDGRHLANYGEYSGGPSRMETQTYTAALIDALLASTAKQKKLIIAGGVANFTDVKATFAGIIDALKIRQMELKKQRVKVFVRRGGPNEVAGLELMQDYLRSAGILGAVHGPELMLTDIVNKALGDTV